MLDDVDKKILRQLQKDAKTNIKEIAAMVHMTKTPVYERIKRLEREGYLTGYIALVDRKKVDLSLVVFCSVSLANHEQEQFYHFTKAVEEIPEVVECYVTTGTYDLILKVVVKDLDTYYLFASEKLVSLPNIGKIQSSFVMNELKHDTVLPF